MAVLCLFTTAACVFDYCRRRIPNLLLAAMAVTGILFRWRQQGISGIPLYMFQICVLIAILYPLFRIGALGAGDVKLFGVAAGYLPFRKIFLFSFISMLIAANISLIKLIYSRQLRKRIFLFLKYVKTVAGKGALLPYPSEKNGTDKICLSGPVLLCLILYLGGVW
ncbi:MAG: prepilin peptidase [Acetatifactor sp.]